MENEEPDLSQLTRQADRDYRQFTPFSTWAAAKVDTDVWQAYVRRLAALKERSSQHFENALDVVRTAAAVDTGAIEGLYETDAGFTFTVAIQTAHLQEALAERPRHVADLITAQVAAYKYVLDFATQRVPIAEAWIRELHAVICSAQNTYRVMTSLGWQEQDLPKGEYKTHPNHVIEPGGKVHSYAPVDMTPSEMHRLCEELRNTEFQSAHSVTQAAFAHYALVAVHPFADGNGRVARALASAFTLRALSVPILILADSRTEYLRTLRLADGGHYQPFVDFIFNRVIEAIRLAEDSVRVASLPSIDDSLDELARLYVTRGGYAHEDVDRAGRLMLDLFVSELRERVKDAQAEGRISFSFNEVSPEVARAPGYRNVGSVPRTRLHVETAAPARDISDHFFNAEVPRDCAEDDDLRITYAGERVILSAKMRDLLPSPTATLHMRIRMGVEEVLRSILRETLARAAQQVNRVYPPR